jgi:hypothetical protein
VLLEDPGALVDNDAAEPVAADGLGLVRGEEEDPAAACELREPLAPVARLLEADEPAIELVPAAVRDLVRGGDPAVVAGPLAGGAGVERVIDGLVDSEERLSPPAADDGDRDVGLVDDRLQGELALVVLRQVERYLRQRAPPSPRG